MSSSPASINDHQQIQIQPPFWTSGAESYNRLLWSLPQGPTCTSNPTLFLTPFLPHVFSVSFNGSIIHSSKTISYFSHLLTVYQLLRITGSSGFPSGTNGKEPACQSKRHRDSSSVPRSERSLGGGHDNSLQYSCLENPQGQRSLAGYNPWHRRLRHHWNDLTHSTHWFCVLNTSVSLSSRPPPLPQFRMSPSP